jgi:N utilization substance protein B
MSDTSGAVDRHAAREAALQMLYEWEVGGLDLGEVLSSFPEIDHTTLDARTREFAERLMRGTARDLERADPLIVEQAQHWRIERMPVIDRLILRMGIHELLADDTPTPVVIDEALKLARTFSTEEAVKFINGILDAIGRRLRSTDRNAGTPPS